ncbi:MAG: acyl carrier protein [Rhodobacterales bacterium]
MSVENKIIEIIAKQAFLEPSQVTLSSTLDALGIDSMGVVECIFAIEEEFDVEVPFNANVPESSWFDISSVQSIATAVKGLIAKEKV